MELQCANNYIYVKRKISKKDMEEIFKNVKTKYKKYLDKFIDKQFNDTFAIMPVMTYLVMLKGLIYSKYPSIASDVIIKKDEENIYGYLTVNKFFDRNFEGMTKEQLEFFLKVKIEDEEKNVMEDFFGFFPSDEFFKEKLTVMIQGLVDIDDIIADSKTKMEKGEQIKASDIDFRILKALFGSFALTVKKDMLKDDPEYQEGEN